MTRARERAAGDVRLAFSVFRSLSDVYPQRQVLSWVDLVERLTTFLARRAKDGPLWSPAAYPAGATRSNDNVIAVSAFVLDVDTGARPEVFARLFDAYAHVIHSTWSHACDLPRWRAVFPLSESIRGPQWSDVYFKLATHLGKGQADLSCRDAARMYFLPSSPPELVSCQMAQIHDGELLDPSLFAEVPEAGSPIGPPYARLNGGRRWSAAREPVDLVRIASGDIPDGQKHIMLVRAILKMCMLSVPLENCVRVVEMALDNFGPARLGEPIHVAQAKYRRCVFTTYEQFSPERGREKWK
jgi:hypothetical protein